MAKQNIRTEKKTYEWEMDDNIKHEAGFYINLEGNWDYSIARFNNNITLFSGSSDPCNHRMSKGEGMIGGLCAIITPFPIEGAIIIRMPENGKLVASTRLSLMYNDDIPYNSASGYFFNGELVAVTSPKEALRQIACDLHAYADTEHNPLVKILGETFDACLNTTGSLKDVKSRIKHSNLPDHYKEAVRDIL